MMDDRLKLQIARERLAEIDAEYRRVIKAVAPGARTMLVDLGELITKALQGAPRPSPGIPIYATSPGGNLDEEYAKQVCVVCGQTFRLNDPEEAEYHDQERHEPMVR